MLFACENKASEQTETNPDLLTQQVEDLTMISSQNGKLSYRFKTPLLERYELAKEPYSEFRKGIEIETYNDSTQQIESTLRANYAIRLETQMLWEAKGNVVATNAQGQKLETEQLFWNEKTKRIYSNVDSKISSPNGDVIIGTGFESDERFEEYVIRSPRGKVTVNLEHGTEEETEAAPDTPDLAKPTADGVTITNPDDPVIREGEPVARPRQTRQPIRQKPE